MSFNSSVEKLPPSTPEVGEPARTAQRSGMALLTGCQDRHYAVGLAMALAAEGVAIDVIGSDEIDSPELRATPNLRFLNFRSGYSSKTTFAKKIAMLLDYYAKLLSYVSHREPKVLHILWNYKLEYFDRTILMLYYKALGKKVVLTAHNVNQARRDAKDSWFNRATLKTQYRLCDHIFVHTERMKSELCQEFGVAAAAVTVIRYPVNNALPDTELTPAQAKKQLGLGLNEKTVLFFGRLVPYKGIECLLEAFGLLGHKGASYRLILAGEPKKEAYEYVRGLRRMIDENLDREKVTLRAEYIPDDEIEVYLKGADVLALPYKEIFQSGVLFMAYSFGLPAVATDVGSFKEDVVEGKTGFLCTSGDPAGLARAIEKYFASDLYRNLKARRAELRDYVNARHSWEAVAGLTRDAYSRLFA